MRAGQGASWISFDALVRARIGLPAAKLQNAVPLSELALLLRGLIQRYVARNREFHKISLHLLRRRGPGPNSAASLPPCLAVFCLWRIPGAPLPNTLLTAETKHA